MISTIPRPVPAGFQFSQGSLQDFVDCPRRFELRHLLQLAWPAPYAEPVEDYEAHIRDGERFHRLIHQHLLGLPPERLNCLAHAGNGDGQDGNLARWWLNYLETAPFAVPGTRHPELTLCTTLAGHRLLARYDLVVIGADGESLILDWKTGRRPRRQTLAARLQTRVYRYVLVKAGAALACGRQLSPEQVRMVYWFAECPDQAESFPYDTAQYQADEVYLRNLIAQIEHTARAGFPAGEGSDGCPYCRYRSLCERGVRAGAFAALEGDADTAGELPACFDLEQIAEIAF